MLKKSEKRVIDVMLEGYRLFTQDNQFKLVATAGEQLTIAYYWDTKPFLIRASTVESLRSRGLIEQDPRFTKPTFKLVPAKTHVGVVWTCPACGETNFEPEEFDKRKADCHSCKQTLLMSHT